MWRPYNETQEDLDNENRVAQILSQKWKAEVLKLSSMLYTVDWAFSRNGVVTAFGEYKKRSKKFDEIMLSAAKLMKMQQLHDFTKLPVLLIIEWPDGVWYWDISANRWKGDFIVAGNSRGQDGDTEPMVMIPISKFRNINL
jgi:hypothetical protein